MSIELMDKDNVLLYENLPHPQLPEKVFREQFLPVLFGDKPEDFNKMWMTLTAGRLTLKVDLLDEDGSVSYVLPPLRPAFETTIDDKLGLLASESIRLSTINKRRGQIVMDQGLSKVVSLQSLISHQLADEWIKTLTHFGYGDKVNKILEDSGSKPTSDTDVDYEEDDW